MNTELVLRPATISLSARCRRGAAIVGLLTWRCVLACAPAINLYWCVGMPPYANR